MINRFILNEVSYFGAGARKQLPEVLARLNLHKALVATDKGLLKVGTAKMVTDVLDEAGFAYDIYSEIKPNPTVTNVKQGVDAFKASGADCIIAIGGGSSMDTAKGIGIVVANPEFADVVSLEDVHLQRTSRCRSSRCLQQQVQVPRLPLTMLLLTKKIRKRWSA